MEKEMLNSIKKDEMGIIPMNVYGEIVSDIKKMIVNSDLSKEENKGRFDLCIKNDSELLNVLSEVAFISFLNKLMDESNDFNLREYLNDKYGSKMDIGETEFFSIAHNMINKYIGLDNLVSKWKNNLDMLSKELERLSNKMNGLGYTDEYDQLEDRRDKLDDNFNEIDDFITEPNSYDNDLIGEYTDKLEDYILKNINKYVDLDVVVSKFASSIDDVSLDTKQRYLDAIKEYIRAIDSKSREEKDNNFEKTDESFGRKI